MQKLIYNIQKNSSFIKKDREILSKKYIIIDFKFQSDKKILTPIFLIYQFFFLLLRWPEYKVIISHISGFHTYLPSILSYFGLKEHYIILHGTDCNIIPEINYGNLGRPLLKWFTKESIKKASLLIPVSLSLIENNTDYYVENGIVLGLNKSMPNFKTPYEVINNGIDPAEFYIMNKKRAPKSFLTVALGLENEKNIKLKGIDLVLNFAKDHPECKITILGSEQICTYAKNLKNVTIVGKVNHKQLIEYYNDHIYYFQLSISESFGLSLCEAMLCGCIPIVSNVGMMPKIIDEYGFVLQKRDPIELQKLVLTFIDKMDESKGQLGSEHIKLNYDIKHREKALLDLISNHLNNTKSP